MVKFRFTCSGNTKYLHNQWFHISWDRYVYIHLLIWICNNDILMTLQSMLILIHVNVVWKVECPHVKYFFSNINPSSWSFIVNPFRPIWLQHSTLLWVTGGILNYNINILNIALHEIFLRMQKYCTFRHSTL